MLSCKRLSYEKIPTKLYRYSDKSVSLFRQRCADIPTKVCRFPIKVYRYSDKSESLFRRKCADIPAQSYLTVSELRDFRSVGLAVQPDIPTCRNNESIPLNGRLSDQTRFLLRKLMAP